MCEGLIDTLGRLKVGDWQQPFTAHPKLDATTGGWAVFDGLPRV
jgi:carotenoid cleavage dioxygenase-like enzyme